MKILHFGLLLNELCKAFSVIRQLCVCLKLFVPVCDAVATVSGLEGDARREQSCSTISLEIKVRRVIILFNKTCISPSRVPEFGGSADKDRDVTLV